MTPDPSDIPAFQAWAQRLQANYSAERRAYYRGVVELFGLKPASQRRSEPTSEAAANG